MDHELSSTISWRQATRHHRSHGPIEIAISPSKGGMIFLNLDAPRNPNEEKNVMAAPACVFEATMCAVPVVMATPVRETI